MDKHLETNQRKMGHTDNENVNFVVKENVSFPLIESLEEKHKEFEVESEKKYQEDLKRYEQEVEKVKEFALELKELFHKSQDTFEKQLSYISAGALALSVGFIKDIVDPIKDSSYKWMLLIGWGLLIFTLLLNLVSHMLAGKYAKKGAKEAAEALNTYDPKKIDKRAKRMERINWITVFTLAGGIILIVLYITFNAIL